MLNDSENTERAMPSTVGAINRCMLYMIHEHRQEDERERVNECVTIKYCTGDVSSSVNQFDFDGTRCRM